MLALFGMLELAGEVDAVFEFGMASVELLKARKSREQRPSRKG